MNESADRSDEEPQNQRAKDEVERLDESSTSNPLRHKLFDRSVINSLRCGTDARAVVRSLAVGGSTRDLISVPTDYRERCDTLTAFYPNFAQYIADSLLPELALSQVKGGAFSLPPTVFVGAPGVGKSLFVQEGLCNFLMGGQLPFKRFNLEVSQASFELLGTSRGWSDSQPGQLLQWLAGFAPGRIGEEGKHGRGIAANGMVIGEELDKTPPPAARFSAMNALLQLLEPLTARCFADQSVPELTLDISRLNFAFTANTVDGIPEPVLSRMHVVCVDDLTRDQSRQIARDQYMTMAAELDLPFMTPELTDEGLSVLSREAPRRQRFLLRQAFGRAIAHQDGVLKIISSAGPARASMGFV